MTHGTPDDPARSAAPELRLLHSLQEYSACVQLQQDTWGRHFNEVVPATILKITNRVGGVVAGAFVGDRLVAFVYGITGLDRGRLAHWSHMLAVRPEYRDLGIGRQLKEFQRDLLARRGVETILWSYDPLVARNAHLNLNRLGARVDDYVVDMYPATASDLHSFGTDRFVVAWPIAQAGAAPAPADAPGSVYRAACEIEDHTGRARRPAGRAAPRAGGARAEDPAVPLATGAEPPDFAPPHLRVQVPGDIEAIAAASATDALAWRMATRRAFTTWLARGYQVAGFRREPDGACYYTLSAPVPSGRRNAAAGDSSKAAGSHPHAHPPPLPPKER